MPLIVRDGTNTPRTVSALQIRDGTNTPRDIAEVWARDSNNVPRLIWSLAPPMSADASPLTVSGNTLGTGSANTDPSTTTPTGGTPPYSYAWTLVSYTHPTVPPTADSPVNATSEFIQTSIGLGQSFSAIFRCTVTDSAASPQIATADVSAFWIDLS